MSQIKLELEPASRTSRHSRDVVTTSLLSSDRVTRDDRDASTFNSVAGDPQRMGVEFATKVLLSPGAAGWSAFFVLLGGVVLANHYLSQIGKKIDVVKIVSTVIKTYQKTDQVIKEIHSTSFKSHHKIDALLVAIETIRGDIQVLKAQTKEVCDISKETGAELSGQLEEIETKLEYASREMSRR